MALTDTGKAIGAVSQMLQAHLQTRLAGAVADVRVGKPEVSGSKAFPSLNLFLYEVLFDAELRNHELDEGQPIPLWLVLKYLLTAFDKDGESDSIDAHGFLGEGMRVLQELAFLPLSSLPASVIGALKDNPENLKITFDQTSSDLLSKLMQGTDEKYRCSVSFEVRPVMIATGEPSSYALLVGIDYTTNTVIGDAGIQIPVLPSMGPAIATISPTKFELGTTVTIQGDDLNLSGLAVRLGDVVLPVATQSPTTVTVAIASSISTLLSAGSYPVAVTQTLSTGRLRSSNLLIANLLPTLNTVTAVAPTPAEQMNGVLLNLDLVGELLGRAQDDVFVALYQNGRTVRVFDEFAAIALPPPSIQTRQRIPIRAANTVPSGNYLVIVRVNGQQAKNSPTVNLVLP
jgi:Pvc16 N-terminal domain/IPT/TIG domain